MMKKYPNQLRIAPRLIAATFCFVILFFSSLGVVTNTHAIAVTTPLPPVPPCRPTTLFPCTPTVIASVTASVIATATPTPTDTPTDTPTPTHHKKATPTPTPYIPPAYIPPYFAPTDTPTPTATPTDTPIPTDTPTDTPTPTPSVVPVVAHSSTPPTAQSGNKSPIIPIFIGLGMVASVSVLVVIGVMLLRRNFSPTPATNLPPSGAPAWSRWRGDSLQGNTLITGMPGDSLQGNTIINNTPLANNGPFPPMNPGTPPINQGPFGGPCPPSNPGNGPQLPFPPANDWFGPPNQP